MNAVGYYGSEWRRGVVTDHVHVAIEEGARLHVTASGRTVLVFEDGTVEPVLCGDLVRIFTEDGPIEGRCGGYVLNDETGCPAHHVEHVSWLSASELQRVEWEARIEGALR